VNILALEENHIFLNDCAEIITQATLKCHGSLISSIGHRLQTVFADPTAEFDNAQHAIKCASSIQDAAQEISVKWRHAINFLVELDIGISTGEIIVGPVGPEKKQHLPVGKNVALAEQLAQLCSQYKVNILLDANTFDRTKDYFTFRDVGDRVILGFTERVDIYTLVSS
jgi:adenylate cyclase